MEDFTAYELGLIHTLVDSQDQRAGQDHHLQAVVCRPRGADQSEVYFILFRWFGDDGLWVLHAAPFGRSLLSGYPICLPFTDAEIRVEARP